MSYQNVSFGPGLSRFADPVSQMEAQFTAKTSKVKLPSAAVTQVVTQDLLVSVPKTITSECSPCATDVVNNSIRVKVTFIRDDAAAITALRTEMNRLLDLAISSANFTAGFVPPVSSTLA